MPHHTVDRRRCVIPVPLHFTYHSVTPAFLLKIVVARFGCLSSFSGGVCWGLGMDMRPGGTVKQGEDPIPCPVGTFNPDLQQDNRTDCISCPAGYYCYREVSTIFPSLSSFEVGTQSGVVCDSRPLVLNWARENWLVVAYYMGRCVLELTPSRCSEAEVSTPSVTRTRNRFLCLHSTVTLGGFKTLCSVAVLGWGFLSGSGARI